jgi:hypothetical protein
MGTQCGKDFITPSPTYEFSEKLSLTPYKKVYSINDTIWVQFQTNDKSLYDKISNSRISTDTTFLKGGFIITDVPCKFGQASIHIFKQTIIMKKEIHFYYAYLLG